MGLKRLFTDHPASVGESYVEHAEKAACFGLSMLVGALACFLHAVFPWACTTVASRTIARLHSTMLVNRSEPRLTNPNVPSGRDFLAEHI
jgi:hypothetical protein